MTEIIKWFWDRFFKIYFAFCLLFFALLVLLMNLPRVLAEEPSGLISQATAQSQPVTELPKPNLFASNSNPELP